MQIESWRSAWREGFLPLLLTEALKVGLEALKADDPRLIQGATTRPPPLMCVQDWLCEAGCMVSYFGIASLGGFGVCKVGTAEEFFATLCFKADERLGEPAACRYFLNWFDNTPRDEMRRELIAEIERGIKERESLDGPSLSPADPGSVA